MIGVDFIGRLGNQMFTCAFARQLLGQRQNEHEPFIANFKRCGNENESNWGDSLKHFNVMPYNVEYSDLILTHGSFLQRVLYLIYIICAKIPFVGRNDDLMSRLETKLRHYHMHFTGAADGAYAVESVGKSVFVRGYFQDRHFFDSIRPVLLKEFTPIQPPLEHNADLYAVIERPNTVCVSVRRGDFLSDLYKKDFHVCTFDYYEKAIKTICMQVADPTFIFFSDDVMWVREHMKVDGHPCYYERGDDPVWEKLRLMYSCHHFIISNSTFAWWAQYLGRREGKIVICPRRWFANPEWHSNLVNDNFLFVT